MCLIPTLQKVGAPSFSQPDLSHLHDCVCISPTEGLFRRCVWSNAASHSVSDSARKNKAARNFMTAKGTGRSPVRVAPSHRKAKGPEREPPTVYPWQMTHSSSLLEKQYPNSLGYENGTGGPNRRACIEEGIERERK